MSNKEDLDINGWRPFIFYGKTNLNGRIYDKSVFDKHLSKISKDVVFRSRCIGTVCEDGTVHIDKIISFDAVHATDDSYRYMMDQFNKIMERNISLEDIDKNLGNINSTDIEQ